jgi:multicomponent Na+:H+ antiporter subunit D
MGAIEKGYWPIAFVIVGSSLLAVVYVGKIVETAYFREPAEATRGASDPPAAMLAPLALLAVFTIFFGFDTRLSAGLAGDAVRMLLGGLQP